MQKLYSTPQAIAYLERHPDAVFESEADNIKLVLSVISGTVECCNAESRLDEPVPMSARWHLVSPKPKRERVYLGTATVGYNDVLGGSWRLCSALRELHDGTWTIYAVRVER